MRNGKIPAFYLYSLFFLLGMLLPAAGQASQAVEFYRGDVNGDGSIDLADPISTLSFLFGDGGSLSCPDAGDANDDGKVDLADAIACLSYLYTDGIIEPPIDACGPDPTEDNLAECVYSSEICPIMPPITREEMATELSQAFLDAFLLDPAGKTDASLLMQGFNLDGLDGPGYLENYWEGDDALLYSSDGLEGVEVLVYWDDVTLNYYNIFFDSVAVPEDDKEPVVSKFSTAGGLVQNEVMATYYESVSFLFMEEAEAEDSMVITGSGPVWEFETLVGSPESYVFIINQLKLNDFTYYDGASIEFFEKSLVAGPGEVIDFQALLAFYGSPDVNNSGPVNLACSASLFMQESPADTMYSVAEETGVAVEVAEITWAEDYIFEGSLMIPLDLPPGRYTLNIYVENTAQDVYYCYDGIIMPVEIEAP